MTQVKAAALRLNGYDDKRIAEEVWRPQHESAGRRMHALCIDMRGFYLKSGQFLGARGDFVPVSPVRFTSATRTIAVRHGMTRNLVAPLATIPNGDDS